VATRAAVNAHEATGKDAAVEIAHELVLDEGRQAIAERMARADVGQHRMCVPAHELVRAALVLGTGGQRREHGRARNPHAVPDLRHGVAVL
jgi:hypothetical protein